jgi:hypothetical protein
MLHGLATLWPSYLSYVLTFMLIGQIWVNHHVMFDHIRSVDRVLLFLNTVLLMDIAFLPFAAAVLAQAFRAGQSERTAVVLHGIAFLVAAVLSMPSGSTCAIISGCSPPLSILPARAPSACAFGSLLLGFPPERCWAPHSPLLEWP